MPDLTISSLRGGLNEDPPISIRPDQCTLAENVEWFTSSLGERRKGSVNVNVSGTALATVGRVVWLYRHLPTTNLADAQLWAMGLTSPSTAVLAYKDTVWHDVAMPDPVVTDGINEYHISGQTLHGKLFIAYKSAVDRLHVFDGGTALRRCGLAGTAVAPTAATSGSGTFKDTRYYRVRWVSYGNNGRMIRSEPTPIVVFTPPGTGSGAVITRPAAGPGESESYWELESSLNNADWYVLASPIPLATTTWPDNQLNYSAFKLSEDIGAYTVIPGGKFLSVDEDRLLIGSSFTDSLIQSRFMWTPPYGATGVGNDERLDLSTNPYLDLDGFEGGMMSNLSSNVNGYVYATKFHHIYQLSRTGIRTKAYEAIPLTKQRGGLISSMVEAFDQGGQPYVFCLDPDIGPIRIGGPQGIEPCGADLVKTWETVNLDAVVPARGLYYPEKRQVHWWVAADVPGFPNHSLPTTRIVLHTHLMRSEPEGARGGYAIWTGNGSWGVSCCMFAENVNDNTIRSRVLRPFIGIDPGFAPGASAIWMSDTGNTDMAGAYVARLRTKPFLQGGALNHFEVGEALLLAGASPGAKLTITIRGLRADKSAVIKTITGVDLTAQAGEIEEVLRAFDNLSLAELQTVQIDIVDAAYDASWQLHQISLSITGGQKVRAA